MMRTIQPLVLGLLLAASVALVGCAPSLGGQTEPSPSGPAWVDIAQGEHVFGSLDDGDVLEVERGSQGGMHIWGGLLASGIRRGSLSEIDALLNGDRPMVEFSLDSNEGNLAEENAMHELLDPLGDGSLRLVGRRVVFRHYAELPDNWSELDYAQIEADLEQQELDFRVLIEDADGRIIEDSRTIHLSFPPRPGEEVDGQ